MDNINAPESSQKQPIPTDLVGILEAGTAVPEHVPAGSTCTTLTLKRTTVPEGHERAIDHFVFESQQTGQVLKTGPNFHKYKVKRSCRPKVRGCALNSVEHPHGGGNHKHVSQLIKSSRQAPPGIS